MESRYSLRSPAVKRLMKEAQELRNPTEDYFAQPLEDNLFEWHFTVRGPQESEFDQGYYHGRIILPPEYPMKPPSIIILTPNGRFEVNRKICLSISGHHPESWQPSWSIRTALLAIIGFMPTHGNGAIGSLDFKPEERKVLAVQTHIWECSICGSIKDKLLARTNAESNKEAKLVASQISMNAPKETKEEKEQSIEQEVEEQRTDEVQLAPPSEDMELRYRPAPQVEAPVMELQEDVQQVLAPEEPNRINTPVLGSYYCVIVRILASLLILLIIRRLFFL